MNTQGPRQPSADEMLTAIGGYVDRCYRELAAGRQIDLSGLDGEVGTLCEAVAKLPARDAEALQPRMQELMGKLTDLGKKLEEARGEVQRQLEDLNLRQKANKAYAVAPGQPPRKPGDKPEDKP